MAAVRSAAPPGAECAVPKPEVPVHDIGFRHFDQVSPAVVVDVADCEREAEPDVPAPRANQRALAGAPEPRRAAEEQAHGARTLGQIAVRALLIARSAGREIGETVAVEV